MVNIPRILVINGHSNAGKTNFCAWLANEAGFLHVDCDDTAGSRGITGHGLRTAWDELVFRGDATLLQREITQHGRSVVLDWPYNPQPACFAIVRTLQAAAIPVWWLDADRRAAQESFQKRARRTIGEFTAHADLVDQYREQLTALYAGRFVVALRVDNSRLQPNTIWDAIRTAEGW
jgi:hypothetical protein